MMLQAHSKMMIDYGISLLLDYVYFEFSIVPTNYLSVLVGLDLSIIG